MTRTTPSSGPAKPAPPVANAAFLDAVRPAVVRLSQTDRDRVLHAHGHTCEEMFLLRHGELPRVPDVVLYPATHAHVEAIVAAAAAHNVALIPYGGGTTVSGALLCPVEEKRMIASVDMQECNRVLWVDHTNMTMCAEAGIIGKVLEERLRQEGVCTGHEPDSIEFSSLGGWVATRASGMRKNVYGNIEDMLVGVRMVTPSGTVEKKCVVPRVSTGPDPFQFILGSEGIFGIITEVTLRIRALPPHTEHGSVVFPTFELGVQFMREVARRRIAPASIRLVDNTQFQFGQALKPGATSAVQSAIDAAKKFYVTKIKGFDVNSMVAATLLFEGTKDSVARNEKEIYDLAATFGGLKGGAENGERGYFLTFVIAYLRDLGMEYSFAAESFETSVPWANVLPLCHAVKARIHDSCQRHGIKYPPMVSCRVTQTYDVGACVYFYFGFVYEGLEKPVETFEHVEDEARDEILRMGGSLSHHHGVGKIRKKWYIDTVSETGAAMVRAMKREVDPQNIMASGNLVTM